MSTSSFTLQTQYYSAVIPSNSGMCGGLILQKGKYLLNMFTKKTSVDLLGQLSTFKEMQNEG